MTPAEIKALVERLEKNEPLPICPYDSRSPEYWTTNDTDPCKFCGSKNEDGAPDLCRGADTRLFAEAATALRSFMDGGWRPIETAPRDGTEILALCGHKVIRLAWFFAPSSRTAGWLNENGRPIKPTHWMPLPTPPAVEGEAGE